jgi:putative endonuclease
MDLDEEIRAARHEPAAYVVASAAGDYFYKGACRDLAKRLADHRAGRVAHTKNRRPLSLVYVEYCTSYSEALLREQFLKSGAGRQWLKRVTTP